MGDQGLSRVAREEPRLLALHCMHKSMQQWSMRLIGQGSEHPARRYLQEHQLPKPTEGTASKLGKAGREPGAGGFALRIAEAPCCGATYTSQTRRAR